MMRAKMHWTMWTHTLSLSLEQLAPIKMRYIWFEYWQKSSNLLNDMFATKLTIYLNWRSISKMQQTIYPRRPKEIVIEEKNQNASELWTMNTYTRINQINGLSNGNTLK